MNCPRCGAEMTRGSIVGDRYRLKWLPEGRKLFLGIWAFGARPLGRSGLASRLSRPRVEGYDCARCRMLVLEY